MSEQKVVSIEINCCPAARGITYNELVEQISKGFVYLDVMPIRREITAQERLTNLKIPATVTHIAEPMMVFFKISPAMPPLPERAVEPGVN